MHPLKNMARSRLARAGITINGPNDWDPQMRPADEDEVLRRVILHGSIGGGETYTEGMWWTRPEEALEEFFYRLFLNQKPLRFRGLTDIVHCLRARFTNLQRGRELEVAETHYDRFSAIQHLVLGTTNQYSCGFWGDGAQTLDEAQVAKMRRIAMKLKLKPGMRVLDVGCGWGGLAKYLADECRVEVVGVTVSKEQAAIAREHCRGSAVEILCVPFEKLPENLHGTFDRIVSVGMFEHVGPDNYKTFFKKARALLKPDGITLLHTIGSFRSKKYGDGWMHKYIFPNGVIPSQEQIVAAYNDDFVMRDWDEFGLDYGRTLMEWYRNLAAAREEIECRCDRSFYNMTVFYLLSCAASFRAGRHVLWQIVFTPRDVPRIEYRSVP